MPLKVMSASQKSFWIASFILGLLILFPLALPNSFKVDEKPSPWLAKVPLTLENWQGEDVLLDEHTYEILETRNVVSRLYKNDAGEQIHLLIVGSHKDRRVAHPPEVCYLGSNFSILNKTEDILTFEGNEIPLKEFTAQNKKLAAQREEVAYFYKIGSRFTADYFTQQLQFAWDRLTRSDSQVLLVRLAGKQESSFKDFFKVLLPHLNQ